MPIYGNALYGPEISLPMSRLENCKGGNITNFVFSRRVDHNT